jgi:hypothetical protein
MQTWQILAVVSPIFFIFYQAIANFDISGYFLRIFGQRAGDARVASVALTE